MDAAKGYTEGGKEKWPLLRLGNPPAHYGYKGGDLQHGTSADLDGWGALRRRNRGLGTVGISGRGLIYVCGKVMFFVKWTTRREEGI